MKGQSENKAQVHHHDQTVAVNLTSDQRACRVTGYINFKNVMKLRKNGKHLFGANPDSNITIDLGGIDGSDNSVLVLLVAWLRDAQEFDKKITYTNVPEFLQSMAQVFELSSILFKA
jgi:ABC-type transporter Mla MlaB component